MKHAYFQIFSQEMAINVFTAGKTLKNGMQAHIWRLIMRSKAQFRNNGKILTINKKRDEKRVLGDTRIRQGFLFVPLTIENETRFWENAKWLERYWAVGKWKNCGPENLRYFWEYYKWID